MQLLKDTDVTEFGSCILSLQTFAWIHVFIDMDGKWPVMIQSLAAAIVATFTTSLP